MSKDECTHCRGARGFTVICSRCAGSCYEAAAPNAPQPLKEQLQPCRWCSAKGTVWLTCGVCGGNG